MLEVAVCLFSCEFVFVSNMGDVFTLFFGLDNHVGKSRSYVMFTDRWLEFVGGRIILSLYVLVFFSNTAL